MVKEAEESKQETMGNGQSLPYGVSRYYAALAESLDPAKDPIAAQFVPTEAEGDLRPYESVDPIADGRYMVSPRVIHHYHDRVLILVNDRCATYCRHCFRRHFTGHDTGRIQPADIEAALDYLRERPHVEEVLLSGGDPLMLGDDELEKIIRRLREGVHPRRLLFRIATRMPVVLPARITQAFARMLAEATDRCAWVVTHANHPRELTDAFGMAVSHLVDQGIPVLNQAVLLRGVNNAVDVLENLFRGLIQLRVKPYYLFQGDLAAGTAHFRTSIEEGLDLMDALRERVSGLAMPCYAVDLPGGGGKIPLTRASVAEIHESEYVLLDASGRRYRYPREV